MKQKYQVVMWALVTVDDVEAETPQEAAHLAASLIRYIKAIKEKRMICNIESVSSSGMSRNIKFVEMRKCTELKEHFILNFYKFFVVMGYTKVKNSDCFRITGCGMDMIFNTNYNIIHNLYNMGFISKQICSTLSQKTPYII